MGFRYNPRIRFGNFSIGKTGATIRTGIPGLTYKLNYSSSPTADAVSNPSPYGAWKATKNTVGFLLLITIGLIFWSFLSVWLVVPIAALAVWVYIYPPLFQDFTYGYKTEGIHKTDKRFKTGSRYIGSRQVVDKSLKIPLTDQQKIIYRLEGAIKLVILGTMLIFIYLASNTKAKAEIKIPLKIKGVGVGSPSDSVMIAEGTKQPIKKGNTILYNHSTFAKEEGSIEYTVDADNVSKVVFSRANDTMSYTRLLKLLVAKYGPPQDTAKAQYGWHGKTGRLNLQKSNGRVEVTLQKNNAN